MNASTLRLTLVRHGETEGQSSIRYHGRTDVVLSALGRRQMACAGTALRACTFTAAYSSRLARSAEAARIIVACNGGTPTVVPLAGFDEVDFGKWEGLTAEEIRRRDPRRFAEWERRRGDFQYPGGESNAHFRARVANSLRAVLAAAPAGELLLVLHKGVIRCVLAELLGVEAGQGVVVALGSIHVIHRAGGLWRADALDRTDHL